MTSEGSAPAPPKISDKETELGARASSGARLLVARTVVQTAFRLARMAILVRLLVPSEFGLFGIAMIAYEGLFVATNVGSRQFLIMRKDVDTDLVATVFSFDIARAFFIFLVLAISAPLYASAMGQPSAEPLMYWVAVAAAAHGIVSPGYYLAERNLKFKRLVAVDLGSALLEAIVVIVLAWLFRSAVALAIALTITAVVRGVASLFVFGFWRPRIKRDALRDLLDVGSSLWTIAIFTLVMQQGDKLVIGKYLGKYELGIYVAAFQLSQAVLLSLMPIVGRVAFPLIFAPPR